jgi:hypothetical protein
MPMAASPDSYALLGLPSGADRAAVDRAYRSLMKRHHPDRGGDPAQAASINRAYADITRPTPVAAEPTPTDIAAALYQRHQAMRHSGSASARRKPRRWPLWLLLGGLVAGIAWIERDPLTDLAWNLEWRYFAPTRDDSARDPDFTATSSTAHVELGSAPLDGQTILAAEASARRVVKRGGIGAAADASRRCYIGFRDDPSLARYDHCVAFDDAVLLLGGFGVADRGGFSAGAVTSRQLAAARALDRDYESIEMRLDRIRLAMMHRLEAAPDPAAGPSPD